MILVSAMFRLMISVFSLVFMGVVSSVVFLLALVLVGWKVAPCSIVLRTSFS